MKKLDFQDYDIVCFMQDAFSASAAAEASSRFTDMQFRVYEGTGIQEAIAFAQSSYRAKLICVDGSNLDLMISQIEPLMEACPPNTNVIVIGLSNDVGIFRDLVQLHVSDYLVKPITPDFLQRSMSNALHLTSTENADRTKRTGKVVLFLSATGGAGSTTVSTNMAHLLGNHLKKKIVLLDADVLFGNTSRLLDIKPTHALFEMLESTDRLDDVLLEQSMVSYGQGLRVIASEEPLHEQSILDPTLFSENMNTLVTALTEKFHYVLVDVPHHHVTLWRMLYSRADIGFVISPLTFTGLRETLRVGGALREERQDLIPRIIVNTLSSSPTLSLKEFEENLGRPVNVVIPYDSHAQGASDAGTPLLDISPKYKEAMASIVNSLTTATIKPPSENFFGKILNKIRAIGGK